MSLYLVSVPLLCDLCSVLFWKEIPVPVETTEMSTKLYVYECLYFKCDQILDVLNDIVDKKKQ